LDEFGAGINDVAKRGPAFYSIVCTVKLAYSISMKVSVKEVRV
jgi:hypothetical protein